MSSSEYVHLSQNGSVNNFVWFFSACRLGNCFELCKMWVHFVHMVIVKLGFLVICVPVIPKWCYQCYHYFFIIYFNVIRRVEECV